VLDAARELLAADGAAVSFDAIARAAGVGVGTVYRHFPDRQALFGAVILDRIVAFATDARAALDADDPGPEFLAFFARLARQAALNQALCDAMHTGPLVPEEIRAEFLAALGDLLDRAQRAGTIRADLDVTDLLDLVIGFAAATRRAHDRGRADRIVAIAATGLRVRGS
jgi:AcrR family transcriptional regulator